MATAKQKEASRRNLEKARKVSSERAHGSRARHSDGLSAADENRLSATEFAFPKERKEPLVDASQVRNAVARFDQVEGVTDRERDEAWARIRRAARRFDVEIEGDDWRDLAHGGKPENG
jgi:hypothetical protein